MHVVWVWVGSNISGLSLVSIDSCSTHDQVLQTHHLIEFYSFWSSSPVLLKMFREDIWTLILVVSSVINLCMVFLYWINLCGKKSGPTTIFVHSLLFGISVGSLSVLGTAFLVITRASTSEKMTSVIVSELVFVSYSLIFSSILSFLIHTYVELKGRVRYSIKLISQWLSQKKLIQHSAISKIRLSMEYRIFIDSDQQVVLQQILEKFSQLLP